MDMVTHRIGVFLLSLICILFMVEAGIVPDLDLYPQIENAHPQEITELEPIEHPHLYDGPIILYNKKHVAG